METSDEEFAMGPVSSIGGVTWTPTTPAVKAQTVATGKASNVVSRESAGVSLSLASAGNEGAAQAVYAPSSMPPVDPASGAANAQVPKDGSAPERSGLVSAAAQSSPKRDPAASPALSAAEPATAETAELAPSAVGGQDDAAQVNGAQSPGSQKPGEVPVSTQEQQVVAAEPFAGQLPPPYQTPTDVAMERQINELLPNLWKASRAAVEVLIGEDAKAAAAARAADFADQADAAKPSATASTQTAGQDAALAQAQAYASQQGRGQAPVQKTAGQGLDTTA